MFGVLLAILILDGIFLTIVVLLQSGKGGGLAAMGGSGGTAADSLIGGRQAATLLTKATWTAGEPFVTLNADNLYPVQALRDLAGLDEPGLPVFTRADLVRTSNISDERVRAFAIIETDPDGYLTTIVEKPDAALVERAGPDAGVSMNCWRLDHRIFDVCRDVPRSSRGEYELPQAIALAVARGMRFRAVPAVGPVLDLSRRADAPEVSARLAGIEPLL